MDLLNDERNSLITTNLIKQQAIDSNTASTHLLNTIFILHI